MSPLPAVAASRCRRFPLSPLPAVAASRCRRFPLSPLPAVAASRCRRFPLKNFLLLFALLCPFAATPNAHAQVQNVGGTWVVKDSNNTAIPMNSDGSYTLTGPVTSKAQESYPGVLAYVQPYGINFSPAYFPDEVHSPADYGGTPNPGLSSSIDASTTAYNCLYLYHTNVVGDIGTGVAPSPVNGGVSVSSSGTLTQTWTWVPAPAPNGKPAPPVLNLLVSSSLYVASNPTFPNSNSPSSGRTGTASASDSFGDTLSVTAVTGMVGNFLNPSMVGKHLVSFPVNAGTGQATVSVSGTASSSSVNTTVPYGAYYVIPAYYPWPASWGYRQTNGCAGVSSDGKVTATAQQDTRSVTISCPVVDTNINGGSQYRDPPLTGPVIVNARGSDGTLRGDTQFSTSYTYTGNPVGAWSAGSTYFWYENLTGASANGVWPSINQFTMQVSYLTATAAGNEGGSHVNLSMYDSNAGHAKASANYYMHAHFEWEPSSWPEDTGNPYPLSPFKVMGPDPEVPSWPTYPWKMIEPASEAIYGQTAVSIEYKKPASSQLMGGWI